MNRTNVAPHIPKTVLDVPGCKGLTVTVYGEVKARTPQEGQEQGYFVALDGQPMVRAELLDAEKAAVRALLTEKYPEHVVI